MVTMCARTPRTSQREPIDYVRRLQHGYVKGTGRFSSGPLLRALDLTEIIVDDGSRTVFTPL
jgi:hypothetical protein